ncbi:histidinol dehydrogenase [Robiginitalea myxolifaciens]|nr:histidinol dehydrogenase [Robiginitalea myxolifaciens]
MKTYSRPQRAQWNQIISRPQTSKEDLEAVVMEVFNAVQQEGDSAVSGYTRRFDAWDSQDIAYSQEAVASQAAKTPESLKQAIDQAYENILRFHQAQQPATVDMETQEGVRCWVEQKPIDKVGIYIPGGTAPLFSTVLMLGVPARVAGCREVVLCSPPNAQGELHSAICYAAIKCGITTVCRVGGIQAIAALTYGTQQVPAVYKIFGPGNQYVTQAKQWASRLGVAIDMPAGPSEVLVVADTTSNPAYVAADLLSQAEHGNDSQVILITDQEEIAEGVQAELAQQLSQLPRKDMATKALENSRFVVMEDREELADFVNAYAPEHLIICHREEAFLLQHLRNAGSVFLGNYSPESAGDYASGTNHTLPTNGFAKQYSGVNLASFTKQITYQRISPTGLATIGPAIVEMAEAEGLSAHGEAVRLRLADIEAKEDNTVVNRNA